MMHTYHWKRIECALAIGVAATLVWGMLSLGTQAQLAEKVVRLHVIANSDTEADQALKLQVRDRVADRAEAVLRGAADRQDAMDALAEALPELEALAAEEISAEGYDYAVTAALEKTNFPTKTYDGFALPAGEYMALRVVIGAGEGRNWWCVVFPPLCTAAAADMPQTAMAAGLDAEDVALIREDGAGYTLKFKSIELWEALRERFS